MTRESCQQTIKKSTINKWNAHTEWLKDTPPEKVREILEEKIRNLNPLSAFNKISQLINLVSPDSYFPLEEKDQEYTRVLRSRKSPVPLKTIDILYNILTKTSKKLIKFDYLKSRHSLEKAMDVIESEKVSQKYLVRYIDWLKNKLEFRENSRNNDLAMNREAGILSATEETARYKEYSFDNKIKIRLELYEQQKKINKGGIL